MLPTLPPFKSTSEELAASAVFFALFGTIVSILGGGNDAAMTGGGLGFGLWFAAWWIGLKEGTLW